MKSVLIYSGGMDSTVLLYHLRDAGHEVRALSFDYGQRHRKELEYAGRNCAALGVEHRVVDLSHVGPLFAGSALTSPIEVPAGHYTDEQMKITVVPNRNMVMLSLAGAWALSLHCDQVAYAAHGGDHTIYPDCRPAFVEAMDRALTLADWHTVRLSAPFLEWTKSDICRRGAALGVPWEHTWSCYRGGEVHCGVCGTCTERREAFHRSGIEDPTRYEEVTEATVCGR